ncbi:carbamoyltransferase [Candidatus Magnetomorum sp. HK-1]|nr:carbamoyltransferase [Candidatus Magnetomorum sp. HK-1]
MKTILGVHDGHDSSAALMIDGEIVAAAQEERFTIRKGDCGYPKNSIDYCLNVLNLSGKTIDEVVVVTHSMNLHVAKIKRKFNYSVDDWVKEQHEFWKPLLFENRQVSLYNLYKDRDDFIYGDSYPLDHFLNGNIDDEVMRKAVEIRLKCIAERVNVPIEKVRILTHEDCHIYYSYYSCMDRDEKIALTSEGIGDYSNGTVSVMSEDGKNELAHTKDNHLVHIYRYITLLLGMKPDHHEYKVMGLAPYANKKELEKSYKIFKDILKIDGLNIVYDQKPDDLYFHFRKQLEGHRFDGIAGAVQKFVEKNLCSWTKACLNKTKLPKICFAGGMAQNIKACKKITEIEGVESLYVSPAAGDSSLPIGACYLAMWEYLHSKKQKTDIIQPLSNIYLGPQFSNKDVEEALNRNKVSTKCKIIKGVQAKEIATRLAKGQIIARCSGRMEFGLRALGNRSIMADPRIYDTVRKINVAIKFRDFWMPFTPSILSERAEDYILNPKNIQSPYMTMAFDSTDLAKKDLIAALHPADFTIRPQILKKESNPGYYEIIKSFEKITGVGGILNTSFNLHGYPIVLGPEEAIFTFNNSELDGLILEDYLILRND